MKTFKIIAMILVLAGAFSAAMHQLNTQADSIAASPADFSGEYNRSLSERLVRFGEVSFERGDYAEAKHFFQEAITADPAFKTAWKKYNMTFLALISAKVEKDPGFLPEFSTDSDTGADERAEKASESTPATIVVEDEEDDDC